MEQKNTEGNYFVFLGEVCRNTKNNQTTIENIVLEKLFNAEYETIFRPSKKAKDKKDNVIDNINKTIQFPDGYNYNTLQRAYKNCNMKNVRSKMDFEYRLINGLMLNMPNEKEREDLAKKVANSIIFDDQNISATDFDSQMEAIEEFPKNISKLEVLYNAHNRAKQMVEYIGNNKDRDNLIKSMTYKKVVEDLASIYIREYDIAKTKEYYLD